MKMSSGTFIKKSTDYMNMEYYMKCYLKYGLACLRCWAEYKSLNPPLNRNRAPARPNGLRPSRWQHGFEPHS